MVKGVKTTSYTFKIINCQRIYQQSNTNSGRLVKSAFWQPSTSCHQHLHRINGIYFADKGKLTAWWI